MSVFSRLSPLTTLLRQPPMAVVRILLAAILSGCTMMASANPWYRIEVMLIAYQDEETIDHELWPDAINAEPPLAEQYDRVEQQHQSFDWWLQPEVSYSEVAWAQLGFSKPVQGNFPAPQSRLDHLLFAEKAARINKRSNMNVIWHQAWIEPVQPEGSAIQHPIDVRLKDKMDIQLRGTINLHLSRYLHINTDLNVQHYELSEPNELAALSLPATENAKTDYRADLLSEQDISLGEQQQTPLRSAHIKQSRRMRSKELHYVDHPMLGLVVKVIPIETEADIQAPEGTQ